MSIFPAKILLATDGSKDAQLASRAAVDLTNATESEQRVVHVGHHPYPVPDYPAYYEEVLRAVEWEAQELLDGQVKKIEEAGGAVAEALLRMGRRDQEIVRLGEELGAGLIVMGSRGLGGLRRTLLGSISDSVLRHAHCCPVLVVRGQEEPA